MKWLGSEGRRLGCVDLYAGRPGKWDENGRTRGILALAPRLTRKPEFIGDLHGTC